MVEEKDRIRNISWTCDTCGQKNTGKIRFIGGTYPEGIELACKACNKILVYIDTGRKK